MEHCMSDSINQESVPLVCDSYVLQSKFLSGDSGQTFRTTSERSSASDGVVCLFNLSISWLNTYRLGYFIKGNCTVCDWHLQSVRFSKCKERIGHMTVWVSGLKRAHVEQVNRQTWVDMTHLEEGHESLLEFATFSKKYSCSLRTEAQHSMVQRIRYKKRQEETRQRRDCAFKL